MQEITPQRQPQNNNQPAMDFDLDSFDFKPITKGLGFHHESKIDKNATVPKPQVRARVERKQRVGRDLPSVDLPNTVKVDLKESRESKKETIVKPKLRVSEVRSARLGVQGTAFVFDMFLLLGAQLLLNTVFLKLSGLTNLVQFLEFTWIEQSIFFSFIFLFYFTVFDLVASPGKRIFSLRLNSTTSSKVTIDQTLIRSVVTLLSFVTVFMPLVFDFQGKLSDTKVVEDVSP